MNKKRAEMVSNRKRQELETENHGTNDVWNSISNMTNTFDEMTVR